MCQILFESVDDFDLFEHHVYSAWSAAWNIVYFVGLNCYLNVFDCGNERDHKVPAWLLISVYDSAASEVNSNVSLLDSVHAWEDN